MLQEWTMRKKPSQGTPHGDWGAETARRQVEVRRTTWAVSKLRRGDKRPVPVAVDLGTGEPFAIGSVNEYDPQATYRREIRERNEIFVPVGKAKTAFIDARDIGAVAAVALLEEGHASRNHDLPGSE